jgi:hypothetical protein
MIQENKAFNLQQEYEVDVSSVYERDKQLKQLEQQIKEKQGFLLEKRKTLDQAKGKNKFLKDVQQDYQKYFQYIVDEKKKQTEAFSKLNEYLDRIIVNGKLTEEEVEKSKQDQKKIVKELDSIKQGLSDIMKEPE